MIVPPELIKTRPRHEGDPEREGPSPGCMGSSFLAFVASSSKACTHKRSYDVRFRGNSGKALLIVSISAFDPEADIGYLTILPADHRAGGRHFPFDRF